MRSKVDATFPGGWIVRITIAENCMPQTERTDPEQRLNGGEQAICVCPVQVEGRLTAAELMTIQLPRASAGESSFDITLESAHRTSHLLSTESAALEPQVDDHRMFGQSCTHPID